MQPLTPCPAFTSTQSSSRTMETTRVNLQDYKKWDTQQGELEGGRNHLWHWIFCIEYLQQAIFHMTSQQIQKNAVTILDWTHHFLCLLLLIRSTIKQAPYFALINSNLNLEFFSKVSCSLLQILLGETKSYQFFFVDTIWRGWNQIVLSKCIQGCPLFCHIFSSAVAVVLDYRYRIAAKFSKPLSTIHQAKPWY